MTRSAVLLGGRELVPALAEIVSQIRVLNAQVLDIVAELEHSEHARKVGYSSLPAFLAELLRISPRRASAMVAQAGQVAESVTPTGHTTPAALPAAREALGNGELDTDHLSAIAEVGQEDPGVVRRHGDVLLARIDQDGQRPGAEEEQAEPVNTFRYRRTLTGA